MKGNWNLKSVDLSNTTAPARQHVEEFPFMCLLPKMMLMCCERKCYLKAPKIMIQCFYERQLKFNIPVNFIFEHVPCRFVVTRRIVPQDLLRVFLKFEHSFSFLKSRFLWQCHRCEFGHHKGNFIYKSTCRLEVWLLMSTVMLWSS